MQAVRPLRGALVPFGHVQGQETSGAHGGTRSRGGRRESVLLQAVRSGALLAGAVAGAAAVASASAAHPNTCVRSEAAALGDRGPGVGLVPGGGAALVGVSAGRVADPIAGTAAASCGRLGLASVSEGNVTWQDPRGSVRVRGPARPPTVALGQRAVVPIAGIAASLLRRHGITRAGHQRSIPGVLEVAGLGPIAGRGGASLGRGVVRVGDLRP